MNEAERKSKFFWLVKLSSIGREIKHKDYFTWEER